jgi:alanine racemase
MKRYTAREIAEILGVSSIWIAHPDLEIETITTDTRTVNTPDSAIFFALSGSINDGHDFIQEAVSKGIKNIVVSQDTGFIDADINFYKVDNTLLALQKLAAYHRASFADLEVLAITGSNGKTTIKEWLSQLILDRQVVKSPKSYNSQTGVALSLWQIRDSDQLGIFEAGISKVGEMAALEKMIKPNIGLFTMIGDAHAEGFENTDQKLFEKLLLFKDAKAIIFEEDDIIVSLAIREWYEDKELYSWGWSEHSTLFVIKDMKQTQHGTEIKIHYNNQILKFQLPFVEKASIDNALHCLAALFVVGVSIEDTKAGLLHLHNLPMRLELKNGINGSILVNDTYNADIQSFRMAMDFVEQQAGLREKVVVISDFLQTGLTQSELNQALADIINKHKVKYVIGIGNIVEYLKNFLNPDVSFKHFKTTEKLLEKVHELNLSHMMILLKGARIFKLEKIVDFLSEKIHTATLETDLQALGHNLRVFSQYIKKDTKIIAVIKASAYGSGSEELAKFLEHRKVAYVAVAYIDEGIQLRKAGIKLPVIILNPDRNSVNDMANYDLEPEVYSNEQLREMIDYLKLTNKSAFKIHIKIDTGMHRMGFMCDDIPLLTEQLKNTSLIKVASVFSHLSSSEDAGDDAFTEHQVALLTKHFDTLTSALGYQPLKHILNSAGIVRFPQYHFDMVRLGLGLYGIDSTGILNEQLEKVHTLKANVIQVKDVSRDAFIGYNRRGQVSKSGKIAVINIGYADGLLRNAGNGRYSVNIHGADFPIIGNVCMDLTIIDLGSGADVNVGDEAVVFGKDKPVESLATTCGTIPYEILSRISTRIKRLYIQG